MNRQEVFDKVVNHLLTQNQKSIDESSQCMYRGINGLMCAVGCLIPDEFYNKDLELKAADSIMVKEALSKSGFMFEMGDDYFYISYNKFMMKKMLLIGNQH